jgi:hypothetical protein
MRRVYCKGTDAAAKEGSKLPEMTVAMIEEFWKRLNKEKTKK